MAADENKDTKASTMTAAQAAKLVKRVVPVKDDKGQFKTNKDGEVITKAVAIGEDEVLNFAEYPDKVVVVTKTGEKLVHTKAA